MRCIQVGERFTGARAALRLLTQADCSEAYVGWLQDSQVNQYLETRWSPQSLESVKAFVAGMEESEHSYLFGIFDLSDDAHVGNLKVGPIHPVHAYADVSYFVGARDRWGRGLASDAIAIATRLGFERLELHRLQAGVYGANVASCRALEKAGYRLEGTFKGQLKSGTGWDDHHWYGLNQESWK